MCQCNSLQWSILYIHCKDIVNYALNRGASHLLLRDEDSEILHLHVRSCNHCTQPACHSFVFCFQWKSFHFTSRIRLIVTAVLFMPFWIDTIWFYPYLCSSGTWVSISFVKYSNSTVKNMNYINILRERRIGHHFADDILKRIVCNEKVWISIKFHWSVFLMFQLTIFQNWAR